eukprot:454622-Rhodomonas_salina.2
MLESGMLGSARKSSNAKLYTSTPRYVTLWTAKEPNWMDGWIGEGDARGRMPGTDDHRPMRCMQDRKE